MKSLPRKVGEGMKPTIPDVMPVAKAYIAKPGNSVGGNLHIVLEDGNVHDDHIKFCLDQCIQANDRDGVYLCELLLRMSRTQRTKISRNIYY